jgi:hypothetical protein
MGNGEDYQFPITNYQLHPSWQYISNGDKILDCDFLLKKRLRGGKYEKNPRGN